MFIVKVEVLIQSCWSGQNQSEKIEMELFEAIGFNIIQERCGMVSDLVQ